MPACRIQSARWMDGWTEYRKSHQRASIQARSPPCNKGGFCEDMCTQSCALWSPRRLWWWLTLKSQCQAEIHHLHPPWGAPNSPSFLPHRSHHRANYIVMAIIIAWGLFAPLQHVRPSSHDVLWNPPSQVQCWTEQQLDKLLFAGQKDGQIFYEHWLYSGAVIAIVIQPVLNKDFPKD